MHTNAINRLFRIIIPLCVMMVPAAAYCQQSFTEGSITYSVSLGAAPGKQDAPSHAGVFCVTVKGKLVRKELKLDNGYQSTIIYDGNSGTAYSLKSLPGKRYAIQLSADELNNSRAAYANFKLQELPDKLIIAGWSCSKAVVSYKNGTSGNIYVSKEWSPADPNLFERLPGIKYLPLAFEYRNDDGVLLLFQAEKVETSPEASAQFRVPADYKIISNEEYRMLNK